MVEMTTIKQLYDLLEAATAGGAGGAAPPLQPPGGGGSSDDMAPRLAKLESDMEHVKKTLDRLTDVPVKLAVIEERVSHLPTKDELGNKLKGYLATGVGIAALINAAITWGPKLLGH